MVPDSGGLLPLEQVAGGVRLTDLLNSVAIDPVPEVNLIGSFVLLDLLIEFLVAVVVSQCLYDAQRV
jgi:hypothetical protein